MTENRRSGKLAVILHADIADSTLMVQQDEHVAHERIQKTFRDFSETIEKYHGRVRELRGDALLADFERASDGVSAALVFQHEHGVHIAKYNDHIVPAVRVGIAMGEVIIADNTLTGAGVVLAQRVEQLAQPGGVCITSAVQEALPKRMPFEKENLGEKTVKGFDEKVRVFAIRLMPDTQLPKPESSSQDRSGSPILSDKPSVAVLPFTNMSGDPEQEYFADGVVDDIITDLSRFKDLLVIARNSSFSFKGKSIKIQDVARELGVRYVVEGSIRKSGNRLRITAQLIDASDETHLWGERYDRDIHDIFEVQDEIAETIVRTVAARVERHGLEKADRKVPHDLKAYDYILQAREVICDTAENNRNCRELYEQALKIDPRSAEACSGISITHGLDHSSGWTESPENSLEEAMKYAVMAVALDDDSSQSHCRLGFQKLLNREYEMAQFHLDKALSLNPNDSSAWAYKGLFFIYTGQPEEAQPVLKQAASRNPFNFTWYLWFVGLACYSARQYEDAIPPLIRSIDHFPKFIAPRRHLAACYAQLGKDQEAAEQTAKILELEPEFSIRRISKTLSYRNPADLEHYLDGLRQAGLPE
jgi:adenylate cyclase